ncbi:MAG TPA: hypothetical protein VFW94_07460 [Candidatus Acidoferrales bacterium]|nr:hypothetical protein [Candidatus Acidoferrales bacterium]
MSSSAMINDWFGAARTGWRALVVLVLLAAVSSFIATAWLGNDRGSIFLGVVFGVAITCGLAIAKTLPSLSSGFLLISASLVAYYIAYLAAFGTQLALADFGLLTRAENWNMGSGGAASPIALLVGGLVGGFLLSLAFFVTVTSQNNARSKLRRALVWSLGSAGLAVLGWALSPILGPVLSPFVRAVRPGEAWLEIPQFNIGEGPIGMVSSVHFVWQIGMALAMGLVAQRANSGANRRGC